MRMATEVISVLQREPADIAQNMREEIGDNVRGLASGVADEV